MAIIFFKQHFSKQGMGVALQEYGINDTGRSFKNIEDLSEVVYEEVDNSGRGKRDVQRS